MDNVGGQQVQCHVIRQEHHVVETDDRQHRHTGSPPRRCHQGVDAVVENGESSLTGDLGSLGAYLNAGAKIYVCDQETLLCTGGPYEVKALVGKIDSQLVLICLTGKEANEVRKIKKPALRIAVLP